MRSVLSADDRLPLTCTRLGTCCHGHTILITPWELALLAQGLGLTTRVVRERFTNGGALLRCEPLIVRDDLMTPLARLAKGLYDKWLAAYWHLLRHTVLAE